MAEAGAAIVDVGGESTRPGALPVAASEEQRRILPVIEALSATGKALISVDTYREETARLAVAAGAQIVTDLGAPRRRVGSRWSLLPLGLLAAGQGVLGALPAAAKQRIEEAVGDRRFFNAELATAGNVFLNLLVYPLVCAGLAVAAGAHIVNDIHGLQREPAIARLAAETGAGLVIMHTGRDREKLPDVIADQFLFLERSLEVARDAGVADNQIVLDPGFGFAKDAEENLQLMARFEELRALGHPWLVGTSRKRMVGHVTGRGPETRDPGTAATSVILRLKGADLFRVHNVAMNVDALVFADAILERQNERR